MRKHARTSIKISLYLLVMFLWNFEYVLKFKVIFLRQIYELLLKYCNWIWNGGYKSNHLHKFKAVHNPLYISLLLLQVPKGSILVFEKKIDFGWQLQYRLFHNNRYIASNSSYFFPA
jgi:hypothetical protein